MWSSVNTEYFLAWAADRSPLTTLHYHVVGGSRAWRAPAYQVVWLLCGYKATYAAHYPRQLLTGQAEVLGGVLLGHTAAPVG